MDTKEFKKYLSEAGFFMKDGKDYSDLLFNLQSRTDLIIPYVSNDSSSLVRKPRDSETLYAAIRFGYYAKRSPEMVQYFPEGLSLPYSLEKEDYHDHCDEKDFDVALLIFKLTDSAQRITLQGPKGVFPNLEVRVQEMNILGLDKQMQSRAHVKLAAA